MLDESGKSKISLEAVIIAMESRAHMNEAPVLFGALVQNLPPRDGELLLRAAREINRRATETHDLKPSDAADLLAKMITRYRAARGGAATPNERTPVVTTLTALRWGLSK
jgi:hypothetical protein